MSDDVERIDVQAVNSPKTRQSLYASRVKIFPKRVQGTFRRFKWIVMFITLGIYYLTPWLRWDRGAYAPDQAVLIDLANRRFYFFFIEIWPQEFYYVAGLLIMAGLGLFLVTSVAGRAWCGYTCPQTVWVDLFLVVERAVEGDRNARMKLDKAPWTFDKVWKRLAKHSIWIVIGVLTGGAWIFYFADAPTLFKDFVTGHAAPVAYFTVAILTVTTYIFGGLMREQVCTYMCPWPRIQAAMLDENSLTVTYNDWRGEPRSRHSKKAIAAGETVGDCVDCNACVAACPMGIDIRDGQQLECITCALCIDACDSVMDKIGKPRGLISYATLADYDANMALATNNGIAPTDPARVYEAPNKFSDKVQNLSWKKVLRPRSMFYFAIWALIGVVLIVSLSTRQRIGINVLHDRTPQYVLLSDGSIRNGYTVKLLNMIPTPRTFELSIQGLPEATLTVQDETPDANGNYAIAVEPDKLKNLRVFVTMPHDAVMEPRKDYEIEVRAEDGSEGARYKATFMAPERK
ncbi:MULTISPECIES: cytochrome c oxidase accessory protein CcoG [unclassified Brucella]|uniref:cytochrome c oxidase accessory protein CcoG n=1 Tax=unclassified Brucella TaxID=2632610 RepID=UPI0012AE0252|nr:MULTISPECIES: cytochrome c oxidase accessory protein CcoG [unclassified Brucella]MRN42748.1 cytochrome c oxidase accessory protein CcoG [Brucella sp. 09RB8913]MRN58070.1 cytochrome c oxidase accessory protein CcoG [Brucella sp. 09RB8918]CAB4327277.1 cytochrome c oxidase accessory protein CcoG [Brucella sp. 191011898]